MIGNETSFFVNFTANFDGEIKAYLISENWGKNLSNFLIIFLNLI